MRYLLLSILAVFSFSSCKKDWACECTYYETKETQVAKYFAQTTKSEAKSLCNLYNDTSRRCEVDRN